MLLVIPYHSPEKGVESPWLIMTHDLGWWLDVNMIVKGQDWPTDIDFKAIHPYAHIPP